MIRTDYEGSLPVQSITGKWAFSKDHKCIGLFKNGGLVFDKHFELTEELLVLPERTGYKVETIEII